MGINLDNYKNKNYKEIRKTLNKMITDNYKEYIKAILSIELSIDNEKQLSKMYEDYMKNDNLKLINDCFNNYQL